MGRPDAGFREALNLLFDLGGLTNINLAYRLSDTEVQSVYTASKYIKKALSVRKRPLIFSLIDYKTSRPRIEQFWGLTKWGADYIGREEAYKKPRKISSGNVEHETGVKDLMITCHNLWPEPIYPKWHIKKGTERLECDFKQGDIFWENERKIYPSQTYQSKIKKYERYDLPKGAKVAIVFSHYNYSPFIRFQSVKEFNNLETCKLNATRAESYEYIKKNRIPITPIELKRFIENNMWLNSLEVWKESHRQFNLLMDIIKTKKLRHDYYFTTLDNYAWLDKKVWLNKRGENCFLR